MDKKGCGDGVTYVVFVCPVLPGHCHPYIPLHFGQCFLYLQQVQKGM